jgi:hypothetical protein
MLKWQQHFSRVRILRLFGDIEFGYREGGWVEGGGGIGRYVRVEGATTDQRLKEEEGGRDMRQPI